MNRTKLLPEIPDSDEPPAISPEIARLSIYRSQGGFRRVAFALIDTGFYALLNQHRWMFEGFDHPPYIQVRAPDRDRYDNVLKRNRPGYHRVYLNRLVFSLAQGIGSSTTSNTIDFIAVVDYLPLMQRLRQLNGDYFDCRLDNICSKLTPQAYKKKEERDQEIILERIRLSTTTTSSSSSNPASNVVAEGAPMSNTTDSGTTEIDDDIDVDPSLDISPTTASPTSLENFNPQPKLGSHGHSIMTRPTDVAKLLSPLEDLKDDSVPLINPTTPILTPQPKDGD